MWCIFQHNAKNHSSSSAYVAIVRRSVQVSQTAVNRATLNPILCSGGIRVLNSCLSWWKFVNTHLYRLIQLFNIHVFNSSYSTSNKWHKSSFVWLSIAADHYTYTSLFHNKAELYNKRRKIQNIAKSGLHSTHSTNTCRSSRCQSSEFGLFQPLAGFCVFDFSMIKYFFLLLSVCFLIDYTSSHSSCKISHCCYDGCCTKFNFECFSFVTDNWTDSAIVSQR